MALDSKGNPTVDFAWGNFPMQPNDQRAVSSAVDTFILNEADEKSGMQRFRGQSWSQDFPESFVPGATIEVKGFDDRPQLNGTYVILEVVPAAGEIKTTTPWIANSTVTSPPSGNQTASFDPNANYGGGKGDASWSKTTKKVSENLDPALDGHNILDLGWNGYPGYTPGVSQPPFTPFTFSATGAGMTGTGTWALNTGRYQTNQNSQTFVDGNGFTFTIASAADAVGAQWAALSEAVNTGKFAGATLTYSGINTMYGPLEGSGQGFEIIAAWIAPDYMNSMSGAESLFIKTVPAAVGGIDMPPYASTAGNLDSYSTFTITGGTGKTGFTVAEIAASYDSLPDVQFSIDWMSYQNSWLIPIEILSAAQIAKLLEPSTVGKFLATSNIQLDPSHMNANEVRNFCDQITQVQEYTDSYNKSFIRVYHDAANDQSSSTYKELILAGEKLVILV